jgi:tripartite-type tricarboxylate transporter receptor subunit TctC
MTLARLIAGATLALAAVTAVAQDKWPSKPIRIITPYPTGVAGDFFARHYATYLQQSLGVPVIVDNKPGASGIIGADAAAKAAPDGYTLLFGYAQLFAINPYLFSKRRTCPWSTFPTRRA